jgi:hypothetical protein
MLGGNVCRAHGGAAPQTKAKAQRRLQQAADVLVQRLLSFALDGKVADPVALQAIRDVLDRAGLNPKQLVEVEVQPWERIYAGIAAISREESLALSGGQPNPEPATVDGEVIDPPEPEPAKPLPPPVRPAYDPDSGSVRSAGVDDPPENSTSPTPPMGRSAASPRRQGS